MKNNRGQTILELAISFPIVIFSLVYFLHVFIKLIFMIAVDDALESYLLCRMNSTVPLSACRQKLANRLDFLNLNVGSITELVSKNTRKISIQISNPILDVENRERESKTTLR